MDPQFLGGGRYAVRGVLGEGAQGVTYDATDAESGRAVAIKRFDVRGAQSWKDVELAERETRVLSTLDHPLVVRYVEHFEDDGGLYLVMEKVEGETLDAIRQREGALAEPEVRRFLACADRALSYLHGRGSPVVHRDIKPRNVVRRPDGSYVLVDFGAVSELVKRRGSSTVVGTLGYMAPEQLQARALPASDVYAVGATAIAALTGMEPETLPHKGLRIDVRAALQGRVSPELVESLERMLEPDPDLRATSLAAALDGMHARIAPRPLPREELRVSPAAGPSEEDALVKSIRGLLWVLWGLGWVIVPLALSRFNMEEAIPLVMFGALAALLVVTWHKGALIRTALRAWRAEKALAGGSAGQAGAQSRRARVRAEARVDVASRPALPAERVRVAPHQHQVRVNDLSPEELVSETEIKTADVDAKARRQG